MQEYKHIPVKPRTYKRIVALGRKSDSFDDIIQALLEQVKGKGGLKS